MNLIYSIVIGDESWGHAGIMVDSVRRFGAFDGDVILFGDRPASISGSQTEVLPELSMLRCPMLGKPYMGCADRFSKYDRVLCLDADVVVVSPMNGIFSHHGFGAPLECLVTKAEDQPAFAADMGQHGYNSGAVVGPGPRWKPMCEMWVKDIVDHKSWETPCCDQPSFNRVVRSGAIQFQPFPNDTMFFFIRNGQHFGPNTVMVHARLPLKEPIMRLAWGMASTLTGRGPVREGTDGDGI